MRTQTRLLDSARRRIRSLRPVVPLPAEVAENVSLACYLPLVQKLAEMRRESGVGVVVAFSAISKGEGVTFVTESLAWELARQTGEQVLLTVPAGLHTAAAAHFREEVWPMFQPVRRLNPPGQEAGSVADLTCEDLDGLRGRFGFVLIDCPAMRESSLILAISRLCDGLVLVVAAGEAKRGEIGYAQTVLRASPTNIIGLVLNKRVDPVPAFLTRIL
jgi:Mrp family chromosome partitioning ATPase